MADLAPGAEKKRPLTRVSRACQECRKRKVKCSFESVCSTCRQYGTACIYREFARSRRKVAVNPKAGSGENSSEGRSDDNDWDLDKPSHVQINTPQQLLEDIKGISACSLAQTIPIELYYGNSCRFSFLEQMHRDLNSVGSDSKPDDASEDVLDASMIIGEYSLRQLYFGTRTVSDPATKVACLQKLASMSREQGMSYINAFFSTSYNMNPCVSKEELFSILDKTVGHELNEYVIEYRIYTLVIILAFGASLMRQMQEAADLFERAEKAIRQSGDIVNIEIAQCHMFMAAYYQELGNPNAAYLELGTAARKALAGGVHTGRRGHMAPEARLTIWAMFAFDTWLSYLLGRPAAFSYRIIDHEMPSPEEAPVVRSVVEVSRALEDFNYNCENAPRWRGSLAHMWDKAQERYEAFQKLKHVWEERFSFKFPDFDPPVPPIKYRHPQVLLMAVYYRVAIATFRTFMVIERRWRNYIREKQSERTKQTPTPRVFVRAREICTQSARKMIQVLGGSLLYNDGLYFVKHMVHFLEEAVLVLIYNMIDSPSSVQGDLRFIEAALLAVVKHHSSAGFPDFASMVKKLLLTMRQSENLKESISRLPDENTRMGERNQTPFEFADLQDQQGQQELTQQLEASQPFSAANQPSSMEDTASGHGAGANDPVQRIPAYSTTSDFMGQIPYINAARNQSRSQSHAYSAADLRAAGGPMPNLGANPNASSNARMPDILSDPRWNMDPFFGDLAMEMDFSSLWTSGASGPFVFSQQGPHHGPHHESHHGPHHGAPY